MERSYPGTSARYNMTRLMDADKEWTFRPVAAHGPDMATERLLYTVEVDKGESYLMERVVDEALYWEGGILEQVGRVKLFMVY